MKRAWEFLLQNLQYQNCLAFLRELDKVVGDNMFYGNGEVRKLPVSIGGTSWTPLIPQEAEIYETINRLEMIDDPELMALKYFCFIARSQIFIDGNKRVAQLMTNKILIDSGVGIFQIPVEGVGEFKQLLISFYETGDDNKILDYMKKYCVQRIGEVPTKYKEKAIENTLSFENIVCCGEKGLSLSISQVNVFNSILKNLRKMIKRIEGEDFWVLYDDNGKIVCKGAKGYAALKGNRVTKRGSFSGLNDDLIQEFLYKTVELLQKRVLSSIKRIEFSMNVENLTTGRICSSETEKGSIDVFLR